MQVFSIDCWREGHCETFVGEGGTCFVLYDNWCTKYLVSVGIPACLAALL